MNRFLLFLSAVSIGSVSNLQAQNSMFDLGLEGGPNLSTVFMSNPFLNEDPKPVIFGSGGFIFQYNFKNFLSIKTGLSYQRKGFQLPNLMFSEADGNVYENGTLATRLDYMTFPVLVKASFGKKVQFFVNAGPYVGYLLNMTYKTRLNESYSISTEDLSKDGINRWDFGVSSGIGMAIPIRTYWVVSVEARNYSGLIDIATSDLVKWATNTTDLRVGIAYKLGFYKEE